MRLNDADVTSLLDEPPPPRVEVHDSASPSPAGDILVPVAPGDAPGDPATGRGLLDRVPLDPARTPVWSVPRADDETGAWLLMTYDPGRPADSLREAGMRIARTGWAGARLHLDARRFASGASACAAALIEGITLGGYAPPRPLGTRTQQPAPHITVRTLPADTAATHDECERALVRARAANRTRLLTDTPASDLTPARFAAAATRMGEECGWRIETLDADDLARGGFGGVLAVARGSEEPPALIDVTYRGRGTDEIDVVLVGKGVTIDCGGMNVKRDASSAATMKSDMGSGAAALGALWACGLRGEPINVRVLVPTAENLPDARATLPGDVIRHRCGRTTEVTLTDAEGRLLLADALAYATERSPHARIVTIGTLSDPGLGPGIWPVLTEDAAFGEDLVAAGAAVGELVCRIPLPHHYEHHLASNVADATNYSFSTSRYDLVNAAVFLRPFAAGSRWAHIDVAGTRYLPGPWSSWPKGATGTPTRTLAHLLHTYAQDAHDHSRVTRTDEGERGDG
jgi:leucyl aminopeptidase